MSAGKGDSPRNCFSKKFKQNYEEINWNRNSNDNSPKKLNIENNENNKYIKIRTERSIGS